MSFSSAFGSVHPEFGLAALLATVLFAWSQGGRAERLGAALLILGWVAARLAQPLIGHASGPPSFLSDAIDASGFLWVAIRYSSLWLGPTLLFYSGDFALDALQMGQVALPPWHGMTAYPLLNGLINYLVLVAVVGGTLATMIKRRRAQKDPSPERGRPAFEDGMREYGYRFSA